MKVKALVTTGKRFNVVATAWRPPADARQILQQYGIHAVLDAGGTPAPVTHSTTFRTDWAQWRVYMLLRARGVPAMRAYRTVKRRGAMVAFAALLLVDAYGRDAAKLVLNGALNAPFGTQRTLRALGLPLEFFPTRRCGVGISARATRRLLKQISATLDYIT